MKIKNIFPLITIMSQDTINKSNIMDHNDCIGHHHLKKGLSDNGVIGVEDWEIKWGVSAGYIRDINTGEIMCLQSQYVDVETNKIKQYNMLKAKAGDDVIFDTLFKTIKH